DAVLALRPAHCRDDRGRSAPADDSGRVDPDAADRPAVEARRHDARQAGLATRTHLKTPFGSFEMSVLPEKTVEHSSQNAPPGRFEMCSRGGRPSGRTRGRWPRLSPAE